MGEVVSCLLHKCHVYVDAGDSLGRTPLMLATMVRHKAAVMALLKGGARLGTKDQLGNTLPTRRPDDDDNIAGDDSSGNGQGSAGGSTAPWAPAVPTKPTPRA